MEKLMKALRFCEKAIDKVVSLLMILLFLMGGLGLYSVVNVYAQTRNSVTISKLQPVVGEDNSKSFDELVRINPEVVGWITIDDTNINYPIAQGEDNMKYLNYDIEGNYALTGSIFLDFQNRKDFSDMYSLLYGHHMEGNAMFGCLPSFADKDFFYKHQTGHLFTHDKTYKLEIFAAMETMAFEKNVFGVNNINAEGLNKEIQFIKDNAVIYRDLDWQAGDRIVALSTCHATKTDGRFAVFCRIVEEK